PRDLRGRVVGLHEADGSVEPGPALARWPVSKLEGEAVMDSQNLTPIKLSALLAVALSAAACVAGCGGDGTKSPNAAAVAEAWAAARNRGDAAKTCSLYTAQIRAQLAAGYGSC